jgi:Flp pilus assembly protein TadG
VRRDRGQATVEAALVLPLVVTMLLAVVQVGMIVRAQVLVTHAAREGARAAAVDDDPDAAARAAHEATALDDDRMAVAVRGRDGPGSRVQVDVTYRTPTDIPLIGALLPDVSVHGEATMRVE